jgi:hypothetical protein
MATELDGEVTPVVEVRLPYLDALRLSYLMRFGSVGDQERDPLIAEAIDMGIDHAERDGLRWRSHTPAGEAIYLLRLALKQPLSEEGASRVAGALAALMEEASDMDPPVDSDADDEDT